MLKKSPQYRHFTRAIAVSENKGFAILDPIFDKPPSGARSLECNEHLQILDSKCDEDFAIQKLFHIKMFMLKCPFTRQTVVKFDYF